MLNTTNVVQTEAAAAARRRVIEDFMMGAFRGGAPGVRCRWIDCPPKVHSRLWGLPKSFLSVLNAPFGAWFQVPSRRNAATGR